VNNRIFEADENFEIVDADVTSMYPSIAIVNNYYPEHLSSVFVDVYRDLRSERAKYDKKSPESAALKLALNGVYGNSNNEFSIVYDPLYTMKVTITGQLSLAMLAEKLMLAVPSIEIIQCNTDGVTARLPRAYRHLYDGVCAEWERITKLTLEYASYSRMFIRDVNSYIAEYTSGDVKRKGAYEWDVEMHQDASALVVQKVAEQVLLNGADIRTTVTQWSDKMDFMMRVKVPRSSKLVGEFNGVEYQLPNMTRYYVADGGYRLIKIMPPLAKNPTVHRRFNITSGWTVCYCNNVKFATLPVNFEYYINEVEKLVLPLEKAR
jgi:hypothetical protein